MTLPTITITIAHAIGGPIAYGFIQFPCRSLIIPSATNLFPLIGRPPQHLRERYARCAAAWEACRPTVQIYSSLAADYQYYLCEVMSGRHDYKGHLFGFLVRQSLCDVII